MSLFLLLLLQASSGSSPLQGQAASPVVLTVSFGEPLKQVGVTYAAFASLPRKTIKHTAEDGTSTEYEGVPLHELLKQAKVPMGNDLRGRAVAPLVLIVESLDSSKAVFAFAEIEPSFSDKLILLVDKRDGKALGEDEGPYRVIVPSDKRHARWLRQAKSFTVKKL